MWHFPMFEGDKEESAIGVFLFEIQNRLIPNIGYTIVQRSMDKYMFSPLSRLYLTPKELKEIYQLREKDQYGVTSDYYHMVLGAVFRYKVLTGEIGLTSFDKPINVLELRTLWNRLYCNQDGLEQILVYMQKKEIDPSYMSYIKLWYDFVQEEMEKPYSTEALGWLVRSFIANDKWRSNDFKEDYKALMWQYANFAKLVVIRQYAEVSWTTTWKEGLDEYNQMREFKR